MNRLGTIVLLLLSILSTCPRTLVDGSKKEHVHFKIYVPEIIKHHVHTKTVFIHVHQPKPKKPVVDEHKESYHDNYDYSSWSSYGYGNHGQDAGAPVKDSYQSFEPSHGPPTPLLNSYGNHLGPGENPGYGTRGKMLGYSYSPQYSVNEDVQEHPVPVKQNEVKHYQDSYEEGYRRGLQSETGHQYLDDRKKFYDNQHEEGDYDKERYQDASRSGYHAGGNFHHANEIDDEDHSGAESRPRIIRFRIR